MYLRWKISTRTSKIPDDLWIALNRGFYLKGITLSKSDLPELLTDDEKISVSRMTWFPKKDQISLDIKEMNFAKKRRQKSQLQQSMSFHENSQEEIVYQKFVKFLT